MQHRKYASLDELKEQIMSDIQSKIHKIYNQHEIEYSAKEKPERTILNFFSWLNKQVPVKKRKVHFSDSLKNSPHIDALKKYKEYFSNGEDMNPYLSKTAMQIKQLDYLQLYWHIYHLHFNPNMSYKRSSLLLLCIINQDDVFFVDVIKHPIKYTPEDFLKIDYLRTIHRNGWMEQIGFVGLKGLELQNPITDSKDIFNLYKRGLNITFEFEGEVFSQMDSITASRHSRTVVYQLDVISKNIEKLALCALRYVSFDFQCDSEGRLCGLVTYVTYNNQIKRCNILF